MAIGGSELLLIVRAQNQASAAIGRVSRDIRGLERQRNLSARLAAAQNRAAQTALRIAQAEGINGTKNIAIRQAILRTENQIANVSERAASFQQRRTAIAARGASIMRQEQAIQDRMAGIEGKRLSIEEKQIAAQQRLLKTQTSIAGLGRGRLVDGQAVGVGLDRQAALLAQHRATTGRIIAEHRVATYAQRDIQDPFQSGILARRALEAAQAEAIATGKVKALDDALKQLRMTEQRQVIDLDRLKVDSANLGREEARLTQLLEDQRFAWDQLSARNESVTAAERAQQRELDALELQLQKVRSAAMENAEATRIQTTAYEQQIAAVKELEAQQARLSLETRRTQFQTASHVGRVAQMGGMVGVAALGFTAVSAAKFQQQATLAATQAGTSYASVLQHSNQIQRETLALMQKFPANAQDVTSAFYDIYSSMDVTDKQATRLMVNFEKLSVAGMAPLSDVTNAGITIMNNFADAMRNPGRAMNEVLATVRYGRLNLQQYTQTLNQLVPAFKGAGQTFLQMNAALAETTRLMPSQRMGATGLARLTEVFSRPDFQEGVKRFGISITDAQGRMLPFSRIIQQFGTSMNPTIKSLRQGRISASAFFKEVGGQSGTIQARRVFQVLIRDSRGLNERLKQLDTDTNELNRSFAAMMQTPGTRWDVIVNRLRVMGILIGQSVLPAFESMGQYLVKAINWFNQLDPSTRRWIGTLAAFASVGVLVGGVLATIVGGIGSMIVAFRLFRIEHEVASLRAFVAAEEGAISAGASLRFGIVGLAAAAGFLSIKFLGLHRTIELIIAIGLARQIYRWGIALGAFQAQEVTAMAMTARLLAMLRMMSLIGVITIGVEVVFHAKNVNQWLRGHIPGLAKAQDWFDRTNPVSHWLNKHAPDVGVNPGDPFEQGKVVNKINPDVAIRANHQRLTLFWRKVIAESAAIAQKEGVRNTPIFQKLYANLARAYAASKADPSSFKKQLALANAQSALQQNVSKQQYDASVRAIKAGQNGTKATDAQVLAAARHVAALKKIADAHKTNLADWKRYEAAVVALQGMGTQAQQAAAQDVLNAMTSSTKKAAKAAKKAVDEATREARQDLKSMAQTVQQTYQNFQSQSQSGFGTIFQGPIMTGARMQNNIQWGGHATGRDLLADLKAQVSRFRQFRREITKLQRRGAPFPLIQQLLEAGPDALPELRALESLNKADFRTYVRTFNTGQNVIAQAAMQDTGRQLKYWHSFGRKAMEAFLQGMDQYSATHPNRWGTMLASMFPSLTSQATHGHQNNPAYVQYIYNGGQMDYSTWLRKSKRHHKNR